ncbi:hypothetical protein A2Y85_07675 [candidate division WOR-3 bacterium RBG_13_43_14]|uniref:Uncharacterized protein n=1 Tax=candidate division WOR-3 bacterium RBG_13_43_14 TaxID=1802590 RepID=A0A1F4UEP0_UNCW3|nr:MAG: hypothetical protein A2Y85_07675 [candidate division WOR-3 bacterium RBG_13_43_14]
MKKSNRKSGFLAGDIDLVRSRIFANKESFHKDQAKLAFPEKIRVLIKLQKIANEIKSQTGREPGFVWKI